MNLGALSFFSNPLKTLVGAAGFEPATPAMSTQCSTAELRARRRHVPPSPGKGRRQGAGAAAQRPSTERAMIDFCTSFVPPKMLHALLLR